jgi:thiol:disulfide interchange protein
LALRAGGQAIGWGFQLQTPVFVAVVAYLLFAMGLSLSGVVAFGAGLAGTGARLADRAGLTGTFFTGVLATIVATPCTAPFMGAATGFALVAPGPVAIGIFLALGLGLAAPYLLATVMPGWQRVLPRPGPWMGLVKQVLAFPLYGTVAWLLWVLIQEVGRASPRPPYSGSCWSALPPGSMAARGSPRRSAAPSAPASQRPGFSQQWRLPRRLRQPAQE